MKVLIVTASHKDVRKITSKLQLIHKVDEQFSNYRFDKLNVDVLVTGVGGIFTTYYLTRILSVIKYDIAVNIGFAVSYDTFLEIGYVVNVMEDRFADLGIEDKTGFYTIDEMELIKSNDPPFEHGVLHNHTPFTFTNLEKLIVVKGITSNTLHGNIESIKRFREKFKPEIETMEGAAFFYCCMKEKVPCYQIRAISGYVDIRNVENWNLTLALDNLSDTILDILEEFKNI